MGQKQKEVWVDYVKVIACVLVVLGHFFQSMVKSNIIPFNNVYAWFNTTIYYFHVPLFFICSGYLFQKGTEINSVTDWLYFVLKKLIVLGIPYLFFSSATWIMKRAFSSAVNSEAGNYFETIFLSPISPYWFLYILFFVFAISISFKNRNIAIIYTVLAVLGKIYSIIVGDTGIYIVDKLLSHYIWFIFGILIAFFSIDKILVNVNNKIVLIALSFLGISLFTFLSIIVFAKKIVFSGLPFALCLLICSSLIVLFITFCGPIIAAEIMSRIPILDSLIYPSKHIRLKRRFKNG